MIINATSLGLKNETINLNTSNIGNEKLFYDAIHEDQSHFVHADEVLESWRIVDDLLCTGEKCRLRTQPYIYHGGLWGPMHKTEMITKWDYPLKLK